MSKMTTEQAVRAMEILAKLYAEKKGINSPQIIVGQKSQKEKERKEC